MALVFLELPFDANFTTNLIGFILVLPGITQRTGGLSNVDGMPNRAIRFAANLIGFILVLPGITQRTGGLSNVDEMPNRAI